MKRMAPKLFVIFVAAILSGCATLTSVRNQNPNAVEQVHEAFILKGFDPDQVETMTGLIIPVNQVWLGDGLGLYTPTEQDGKKEAELRKRKAWTGRIFDGDTWFECPAFVNRFGTQLIMACAGKSKAELLGKTGVILSGSKKYAHTFKRRIASIDLEKITKNREAREDFFTQNPSSIAENQLVDLSADTPQGRIFLERLRKEFPEEVVIDGETVRTDADIETIKRLVGMTNNSKILQRIVSKGSLSVSVSSFTMPTLEIARTMIVLSLAAADDTLRGSFFEAKVSGLQAGEAFGEYLRASEEERAILAEENRDLRNQLQLRRRTP